MQIQGQTSANEPNNGDSLNPQFFGATTQHGSGGQSFWITPPPIAQSVTVYPPAIFQNGVLVNFPAYTDVVEMQPPAKQVTLPGNGGDVTKNAYESVGIINQGGQIRLCALLRPNVVAVASHYDDHHYEGGGNWAAYAGLSVRFIGSTGSQSATLTNVAFHAADFLCFYLDQAINVVAPATIAPLEPDTSYVGRAIVLFGLYGLTRPVAATTALKYSFANGATRTAQASNKSNAPVQIQPGDSGSPSFIFVNGSPCYFGSMGAINLTTIQINVASPHADAISKL